MQITEQWILSHAPSPAVAEEGRALSEADCFDIRRRTKESNAYWAECAGSAQNPYYVSIDFSLSEKDPTYSCSCPSRHYPCKHAVGLMFEIMEEKTFEIGKPPSYIAKARTKEAAERARAEARLLRIRKYGSAGKERKLDRQMEGLSKAENLIDSLFSDGIVTVSDLPPQTLDRLAAELGNSGLPGGRIALERVAMLERQVRLDPVNARRYYVEMLRQFTKVRVMIRKSRDYLTELQTSGSYAMEDPILYELLGGIWNSDELRDIGSCRKNAMLAQLSFDVSYDEATRVYSERGYWLDLTRGDIVRTLSTYPARSSRYIASDDSCFTLMEIPILYETPVYPCPRVWWDSAVAVPLTAEDRAELPDFAESCFADVLESARELLSEPLLPDAIPAFLSVGSVGRIGGDLVLESASGERIVLRDRREDGAALASVGRLTALPQPPKGGEALFGLIFYDEIGHRICLHPYSLVRANEIVRLQF